MTALSIIAIIITMAWRGGWLSGPAEPPDYSDYRGDPTQEDDHA
jgi:hypothetical protein